MSPDRKYYQGNRQELAPFLPSRYQRVLEVGCGEGNFAANLRQDAEIWGCEPDADSAAVAASKMTRVLNGFYDDIANQLPDGYFDLVVCNDVIEHMANHLDFLKSIHGKMAENSCLAGSVPNVRYYRTLRDLIFKKDWKYVGAGGVLDATHLRFFTERSLIRALSECGFRVRHARGINAPRRLKLSIVGVILLTLGTQRDIRFKQIAFQAERMGRP